jgi:flagellar biosynthesis component FlhA
VRELIVEPALQQGVLHVHRMDPLIEDALRAAQALVGRAETPALPGDMAQDVIAAIRTATAGAPEAHVLVTQPTLRRALFELVSPELPGLRVLSYDELPPAVTIEEGAAVRV